MKIFLNKQREILAILIYAGFIVGLIYLGVLPLVKKIADTNDKIQQENAQQEGIRTHINELPKIQKQYQDLQDKGDLMGVLLNKNKAVVLIERLEELASNTDNKITISIQDTALVKNIPAVKTADSTETLVSILPNPNYLQMKINLDGSYNSVIKFFSLLEKFEYYSDIIAIQINKSDLAKPNGAMFSDSSGVLKTDNNVQIIPVVDDKLSASLDVVFYTN